MASNTELNLRWTTESRLWLVLDHEACAPRQASVACAMAISGGVDAVLCRLRNIDEGNRLLLAKQARQICRLHGIPFIVSHDPELAAATSADGIQFGKADGELSRFGELTGQGMPWGYSSHSIDEAARAIEAGAAWVFLGPVFETPEKLQFGHPLGLELAAEAMQQVWAGKLVLIGGINQQTLPALVRIGGRRIAAIGALQRTDDPMLAAQLMRKMLGASTSA